MPIRFPNRPGLVAYITAGDPDLATTRDIALAAIDSGADVLELGVPFSDPLADGPVIQRASARAVAQGVTLTDVLSLSKELRQARPGCGLVLFTYLNPVVRLCEAPASSYETVKTVAEGEFEYTRKIGSSGNYGRVKLRIAPNRSGNRHVVFTDQTASGSFPSHYLSSIQKGIREGLQHGVVAGHPLVNAEVTLLEVGYHETESNGLALQIAASRALQDAARKARPTLIRRGGGMSTFCSAAAEAGLDGVLLIDMIPEEAAEYLAETARHNLAPVFLAAPTSTDARLKMIAEVSRGFVYAVSRVGITGTQDTIASDAPELVARLRRFTQLPIAVGFGISNAEHVRAVGTFADAAVIGSALVSLIERSQPNQAPAAVGAFIQGLRP